MSAYFNGRNDLVGLHADDDEFNEFETSEVSILPKYIAIYSAFRGRADAPRRPQ